MQESITPPTQKMVRRFANEIRQKLNKVSGSVSQFVPSLLLHFRKGILVKKTKPREAARNMRLSYKLQPTEILYLNSVPLNSIQLNFMLLN
jgi:hypothetical protein